MKNAIVELLCPKCNDTWIAPGEITEKIENVERHCQSCGYYGLPEKHIIGHEKISALNTAVDRLHKKLKEAAL